MRMIILAAGTGSRLAPLTDDRPKCLVELHGRPLLEWTLEAAKANGVDEVIVIGGYRAEQLSAYDVTVIVNEDYETTNMVHTLFLAQEFFGDGFVMSYGDIVYTPDTLQKVLMAPEGVNVVVDQDWRDYWEQRFEDPLEDAETLKLGKGGEITEIGSRPSSYAEIDAQYIGLVSFKQSGVASLNSAILVAQADHEKNRNPFGGTRPLGGLYMTDLLQGMIILGEQVMSIPINGQWVEIDNCHDLEVAEALVRQGQLNCGIKK